MTRINISRHSVWLAIACYLLIIAGAVSHAFCAEIPGEGPKVLSAGEECSHVLPCSPCHPTEPQCCLGGCETIPTLSVSTLTRSHEPTPSVYAAASFHRELFSPAERLARRPPHAVLLPNPTLIALRTVVLLN